jgi:hypothetical protein
VLGERETESYTLHKRKRGYSIRICDELLGEIFSIVMRIFSFHAENYTAIMGGLAQAFLYAKGGRPALLASFAGGRGFRGLAWDAGWSLVRKIGRGAVLATMGRGRECAVEIESHGTARRRERVGVARRINAASAKSPALSQRTREGEGTRFLFGESMGQSAHPPWSTLR